MARPDQALSFHRIAPGQYELSGLRTGSVRDQILRAQLLVERLLGSGDVNDEPLLVVGGGVAGICAALTASRLGRDVTLVEKYLSPFHTQARVTTRWLDPTAFDWPHMHWTKGDMAWNGTSYQLPYIRNWSDQLATQWTMLWYAVVGPSPMPLPPGSGLIVEYTGVDARTFTFSPVGNGVHVTPMNRSFCAVVSCIGFSGERTSVQSTGAGSLEGPAFWSTDALALKGLGIGGPPHGSKTRVLISGGGDGAQQDFLRVLTGKFGKELFDLLGLNKLQLDLTEVLLAEDSGRRVHAWSDPGAPPMRAYVEWHAAYERLSATIWNQWEDAGEIAALCSHLDSSVEVTWLVREAVPGYCYGLNRLLALLVARLHAEHTSRPHPKAAAAGYTPTGREVYLAGFKLAHVVPRGAAHACGPACYGHEHDVHVLGTFPSVALGTLLLGRYQVLVLRHGINSTPLIASAPVTEQLTPFDLPA